jgi:hypothetical protein
MFKKLIIPIIVVVFVSACSSQETLSVENAWARPGISGGNTAIYFQVNNEAGEQDSLGKVSVSINAKAVELHMTMMSHDSETDQDIMKMMKQENVEIPANSIVNFEPGGLHVMVIGLDNGLMENNQIRAVLHFAIAGEIEILVPISMDGEN